MQVCALQSVRTNFVVDFLSVLYVQRSVLEKNVELIKDIVAAFLLALLLRVDRPIRVVSLLCRARCKE